MSCNAEFGAGTAHGRGDSNYTGAGSIEKKLGAEPYGRDDGPDGITPGTHSKEFEGN